MDSLTLNPPGNYFKFTSARHANNWKRRLAIARVRFTQVSTSAVHSGFHVGLEAAYSNRDVPRSLHGDVNIALRYPGTPHGAVHSVR